MSDTELISFADTVLGLNIHVGTPRNTILTRIVNAAMTVTE